MAGLCHRHGGTPSPAHGTGGSLPARFFLPDGGHGAGSSGTEIRSAGTYRTEIYKAGIPRGNIPGYAHRPDPKGCPCHPPVHPGGNRGSEPAGPDLRAAGDYLHTFRRQQPEVPLLYTWQRLLRLRSHCVSPRRKRQGRGPVPHHPDRGLPQLSPVQPAGQPQCLRADSPAPCHLPWLVRHGRGADAADFRRRPGI